MMSRNRLITIAIAILSVAVYFAVIPAVQLKSYKHSEAKHAAVNDKLVLVYANFKHDALVMLNPVGNGSTFTGSRRSITDAQAVLASNEPALTNFKPLPLLGWNKAYKAAADTAKKEAEYTKNARTLLSNYSGLLDTNVGVVSTLKQTSQIEIEITRLRLLNNQIAKEYAQF